MLNVSGEVDLGDLDHLAITEQRVVVVPAAVLVVFMADGL